MVDETNKTHDTPETESQERNTLKKEVPQPHEPAEQSTNVKEIEPRRYNLRQDRKPSKPYSPEERKPRQTTKRKKETLMKRISRSLSKSRERLEKKLFNKK